MIEPSDSAPSSTLRSLARTGLVVGWIGGLAAAWTWLRSLATGALAAPPLSSWSDLERWANVHTEAEVVMSLVRLVAMGLVIYLLALSCLGALLRLGGRSNTRLLDRITPRWLVDLLDSALGLGLGVALGLVALTSPGPDSHPEWSAPHSASSGTTTSSVAALAPLDGADPPILEPIEQDPVYMEPLAGSPADPRSLIDSASAGSQRHSASDTAEQGFWFTEPGDHLWRIAEESLQERSGGSPTEREIASYWRQLIELNRDALVDPGNPDLILPGQVFQLPPLP